MNREKSEVECPNCGVINNRSNDECWNCGYEFETERSLDSFGEENECS